MFTIGGVGRSGLGIGKAAMGKGRFNTNQFGAMCIALLFSITTDTRLLEAVGITVTIPLLDGICTGLLMSRGSNFVHMLLDGARNRMKA